MFALFTAIVIVVAAVLSALVIVETFCWLVVAVRLVMAEFDDTCKYLKCETLFFSMEFWQE